MSTLLEQDSDVEGYVVSIGTYDGVHLGHRELIAETRRVAADSGLRSAVVTFDRHPAEIVRPALAPQLLTGLAHKVELIEGTGIDRVVVLAFDEQRAAQSAEDFVEDLLVGELGARAVVVGANFRFGHRQRGDVELLETLGARLSLRVHAVDLVTGDAVLNGPVSSAGIRQLIGTGDLDAAAELLGRPHEVRGELQREGNEARIELSPRLLLPPPGRYHVAIGPPSLADELTVAAVRAGRPTLFLDDPGADLKEGQLLAAKFFDLAEWSAAG
jgi:riboflavin kinase/FMN adenylyltransferase